MDRLTTADLATVDAAMTLHVAMNIAAKDRMYAEARRVLSRAAASSSTTCFRAKAARCIRCPGRGSSGRPAFPGR